MLQTEFNFQSLMLRDEIGQYRIATGDEILEAAQWELKKHFSRGATMDAAEKIKNWLQLQLQLQLQLAKREHENTRLSV